MIPLAILVGVVVGRWWAIPLAAIPWTVVLSLQGGCNAGCLATGFGLAAANTTVAVLARYVLEAWVRRT